MGGINDSPTWHYSMVVSDKTPLNYELKLGILDKGGYLLCTEVKQVSKKENFLLY